MHTLAVSGLNKRFGNNQVIRDLSFQVPEHSIFGFIGKNGAGKTTTMKMILGLLNADSGEIKVLGEPVFYGQTQTNRMIGYLPDVPQFYNYMKPREYLKLCGEITGLPAAKIKKNSARLLEMVGLKDENRRIGGFSRGMKQRLGIAQALLNEPKLLICDEPTSALDPVGRQEILRILEQVKGHTTVVFSTHILSDVERICDRVALLNEGKVVLSGTLEELKKQQHNEDSLRMEFANKKDRIKFMELIGKALTETQIEMEKEAVILHAGDRKFAEQKVLKILYENDLLPQKMEVLEPTLENLFMEAIQ